MVFLPINPSILVSHGYCLDCCKKYFPHNEWVKAQESLTCKTKDSL